MTHLGSAIQILEDAMRIPIDLASVSTETLYGRMLGAVAEARNQLYSVDAADAGEHLLVDVCQARAGSFRCRAPAVVLDDSGVAWCAQHAPRCGQCDARPAEVVSPDCAGEADALASPLVCRDCACDSEQAAADERRERGETTR